MDREPSTRYNVYAPAGPPGIPTVTFPFRQTLYVDGTACLTKLVIGQHSTVVAPAGYKLVMTVDDDFGGPHAAVAKTIQSYKTYIGYITITVVPL